MNLPKNLAAERAILGIILNSNNVLFDIDLSSADFAETYNGELFNLLSDQIEANNRATPATLLHDAQDAVIWGELKASEYLTKLADEAPPEKLAQDFARTVKDTALRRKIITIAEDIKQRTYAAPVSLPASELREEMDESIARMRTIEIVGDRGEVAMLLSFARTVLGVGMELLGYLVQEHEYEPRHFRVEPTAEEESSQP